MNFKFLTVFLLFTHLGLLMKLASAQEWTQFRGTGTMGHSSDKNVPSKITEKEIKWVLDLPGTGHSSPVVWGNSIFLTLSSKEAQGTRYVMALSLDTGKEKWRNKQTHKIYRQHRFNDFSSSTPCCDKDRVYVAWTSPDGVEAIALDHNGKEVWKKKLGKFYAKHGSSASPVLAGGSLVIGSHGEEGKSYVVGLNPENGVERWRIDRDSNDKGAYSTPVFRTADDGIEELIFSSTAHGITAIDPRSGKIRWEHDAGFSQRCVSGPVISGNTIFVSAGSGSGGKESAVVRVKSKKPSIAWEAGLKGLPYVPTGISHKGMIFLLNDGGVMTCRSAKDGKVHWQERVVGAPYSSPIIINDRIYCCSKEGELNVLNATNKLEPVSSFKFDDGIYATPAVANGNLLVRTFSKIYCISK
jgi:outer membrane protein assembly factor BamB